MHEIIKKISDLSLESSGDEVLEKLGELKSDLIKNGDLAKSVFNANFLHAIENLSKEER
jgi:hypothetical protein